MLWSSACAGCGRIGPDRICVRCRAVGVHATPSAVSGVRGAWTLTDYDHPLGDAVRRCKVQGDRHLAGVLAEVFARRLAPYVRAGPFQALVPAPSAPWPTIRRGFVLPAVLAHALGRHTGLPVHAVVRRRGGTRQAGLGPRARRANLKGRIRAETSPSGWVLLIDDVVTTGATAEACARELLGAGAGAIWLATVCRASTPPLGR